MQLRHNRQDLFRRGRTGSGSPLLAGPRSSCRAEGCTWRAGVHFDQPRRAAKPDAEDVPAAVHEVDERFQQEARKPHGRRRPLCRALQFLPRSRSPTRYAGDAPRDCRSCLDNRRAGRCSTERELPGASTAERPIPGYSGRARVAPLPLRVRISESECPKTDSTIRIGQPSPANFFRERLEMRNCGLTEAQQRYPIFGPPGRIASR